VIMRQRQTDENEHAGKPVNEQLYFHGF
jgi:hypothetical protein